MVFKHTSNDNYNADKADLVQTIIIIAGLAVAAIMAIGLLSFSTTDKGKEVATCISNKSFFDNNTDLEDDCKGQRNEGNPQEEEAENSSDLWILVASYNESHEWGKVYHHYISKDDMPELSENEQRAEVYDDGSVNYEMIMLMEDYLRENYGFNEQDFENLDMGIPPAHLSPDELNDMMIDVSDLPERLYAEIQEKKKIVIDLENQLKNECDNDIQGRFKEFTSSDYARPSPLDSYDGTSNYYVCDAREFMVL